MYLGLAIVSNTECSNRVSLAVFGTREALKSDLRGYQRPEDWLYCKLGPTFRSCTGRWARGGILATKERSPDSADVFYGHHSYKGHIRHNGTLHVYQGECEADPAIA